MNIRDNSEYPAFSVPENQYAEGLTKLEYIATHIPVKYKNSQLDEWSYELLTELMGRPSTSDIHEQFQWWAEAEAKIRIIKAKALLAELEKQ